MSLTGKNLGVVAVVIVIVGVLTGVVGYYIAPRGVGIEEAHQEGYDEGFEEGRYPNGILKLGLLAPLTGGQVAAGEAFVQGAEWAVEEINALGGICGYKVTLVKGDTEDFETSKIQAVIEKLITADGVQAMFGGHGSIALVEYDVVKKYDMIFMFGAEWQTHEKKWLESPEGEYKTCFNIVSSYRPYRWHVPITFDKWVKEGKLEIINNKVAIVYSDNYYSSWIAEGLRENFEDLGYEISLWEMVPYGTVTEWGSILAKIRADPPGLVINTDWMPSNEAAFVEQFLENPTKSHMFLQYAPSTPEFVELLGEKCSGIIYNSPSMGVYTAGNKMGEELIKRAVERFGFEPHTYCFTLYEELWIYKQACELAQAIYGADPAGGQEDRLLIAKTMEEKTAWRGSTGLYVFDEIHCLDEKYSVPIIYQLWEGERLTVEPETYANAEIQPPPWWDKGIQ
jgi:branched-chain amino acid transport system substrate-binding protein